MTKRNESLRLRVNMQGWTQNCVSKAILLEEVGVSSLPKMSALALYLEAFHLFTLEVGVVLRCLHEGFDDVDAFHSNDVVKYNKREEDANEQSCLSTVGGSREGLVKANSWLLTVAAEHPACFTLFEGAVAVEEDPPGLADGCVLRMLYKVKGRPKMYPGSFKEEVKHRKH
eukprot:6204279-Pleurochrysis_carterae.AAC.2